MADPPQFPPQRRFKTRAGIQRQTAEERAAAIQAEALRQANQIQSPSSQPQHDTSRRGGLVPRDARIRNENTGSVFSSTGASAGSRTKSGHAASGTEELLRAGERSGNVTVEAEGSRKAKVGTTRDEKVAGSTKKAAVGAARSHAKKDEIIYVSEDEAEGREGKAVDIEDIDRISISSGEDREDDEEDDIVFSRKRRINRPPKPTLGLRPVRAARDLHPKAEDPDPVYMKERRKGKGKEVIKNDVEPADKMDHDIDGENAAIVAEQTTTGDKATGPSQSPTKRRRKSTTKDAKPQPETVEERAERERYSCELQKLRAELLSGPSADHPSSAHPSKHSPSPLPTLENDRLYLFQFPPLTPMLVNPASRHHHDPDIKAEPSSSSSSTDPTTSAPPPTTTATEPALKKENDTPPTVPTSSEPAPTTVLLTAADRSTLPPGRAGTLHVHRSGKVTLEWGCGPGAGGGNDEVATRAQAPPTNLEVKWGAEVDFLQDVVLLEGGGEEVKAEGEGEGGGEGAGAAERRKKAWALRQLRAKFVLVPDWGRIYD